MRPRERLGRELRQRRLLAGYSGPQLAELIGVTQSKVSRTETAKFRPDISVIRRWLDVTGTTLADHDRIMSLAEDAATEIVEYRSIFRGSLLTGQATLIKQDAAAQSVRHFQPFQIPGPLQPPQYARNALRSIRTHDETELEEAVAARMQRGERLRAQEATTYHVILTEPALHYRPWGVTDAEQREAWRKVLEFAAAPSITVQIIPLTAPFRQAPMCAFILTRFQDPADPTIVQVELPAVEMTFSGTADLDAFEKSWQYMVEAALDPEESSGLLDAMLRR
jgi:transcriptional regulator with XRE-family HTH domain